MFYLAVGLWQWTVKLECVCPRTAPLCCKCRPTVDSKWRCTCCRRCQHNGSLPSTDPPPPPTDHLHRHTHTLRYQCVRVTDWLCSITSLTDDNSPCVAAAGRLWCQQCSHYYLSSLSLIIAALTNSDRSSPAAHKLSLSNAMHSAHRVQSNQSDFAPIRTCDKVRRTCHAYSFTVLIFLLREIFRHTNADAETRADLGGQGSHAPPRCQRLCNMTLKKHNAGVYCNKNMPPMASIYAFHFHLALNFRLCTFKNAPASGGTPYPRPLPGLRPGPHWGTSVVVSYNHVTISVQASVLSNCRMESNWIPPSPHRNALRLGAAVH